MRRRWPIQYRVLLVQGALVGVCALLAAMLAQASTSALLGGACVLGPNGWLAMRSLRRAAPGDELANAAGLFLAMFAKLMFTVALMVLVLAGYEDLNAPAFFAGMMVAMIGHHAAFLLPDEDPAAVKR